MKWLYVNDHGERRQVSAKTRSWDRAQEKAHRLEEDAKRRAAQAANGQAVAVENELITIKKAIGHHLEDKRQQNCEPATVYKLEILKEASVLSID